MGDIADMMYDMAMDELADAEYSLQDPVDKTCRYCGQRGLFWRHNAALGWRLYSGGLVHTCSQHTDWPPLV